MATANVKPPNMSLASSLDYEYRSTTGAYSIVSGLGTHSREIIVAVGGTLALTRLDGTTTATGTVNAGDVLTVQATDLTLGGGAEVWILT